MPSKKVTTDCGHAIFYQRFECDRPRCKRCSPPVSTPYRVGVLQPDGTIKTGRDFTSERRAAGDIARVRAAMGAWLDDFEIIAPEVGTDGWPAGSFEYRSLHVRSLVGGGFPPHPPVSVPDEIKVPDGAPDWTGGYREHAERERRRYLDAIAREAEDVKKRKLTEARKRSRSRRRKYRLRGEESAVDWD